VQGWRKHNLTREGDPYEIMLFLQDSDAALKRLLSRASNARGFAFHPKKKYDPVSGERRVSTPQKATWWKHAQVCCYIAFGP
jgi:hypothetical protein